MSSRAIAVLILTGLILASALPSAAAEPGKDPNGRSSQAPGQQEDHPKGRNNPDHPNHGRRDGGDENVHTPVAPELTVHEHPEGNHLVWTEPDALEVTGYQIYSIPPGGQLEPVAQVDAAQLEYLDAARSASAWYVVIPVMQEGMGPSSNPASATGCSWLTIDTPPILRPECLPVDLPLLGPSLGDPFQPPIESDYRTIQTD